MSQSQNEKALNSVEAAMQQFAEALSQFQGGERYWRSWERSREFMAAARKAQSYLELACEALDEPAREAAAPDRKGWLGRTVEGLAQYLSQGENDGGPADESRDSAESIRARLAEGADGRALEGNGAVVELPDLIGMIRAQGMTGVLSLNMPKEAVRLHFEAGQLVHAYSENAPSNLRLGEILVDQGSISQERLTSLLYCHQSSPQMLGEILLNGGVVTSEQMNAALNHQIQCLFDRLFTHRRQAHFRFEPGLPEASAHRARVNVLQLLLESARSYDERQAG